MGLPRHNFTSAVSQPADKIEVSLEKAPKLAARAADLDRLYRNILSRPPPEWEFRPSDRFDFAVPNFLLLRQISQTIDGDAFFRLARGDKEGAAEALAAGRRITDGLRQNPLIVSCMIRVAIEALFAPATARLPEDANAWEHHSICTGANGRGPAWRPR